MQEAVEKASIFSAEDMRVAKVLVSEEYVVESEFALYGYAGVKPTQALPTLDGQGDEPAVHNPPPVRPHDHRLSSGGRRIPAECGGAICIR